LVILTVPWSSAALNGTYDRKTSSTSPSPTATIPSCLKRTRTFLWIARRRLITVDTSINRHMPLPTVAVAGHRRMEGVTNIVLDHRRAAWLALNHLVELGHKEIAFMKGSQFSSDCEDRWTAIREVAAEFGITMSPELIIQLEAMIPHLSWVFPSRKNCSRVEAVHSSVCLQTIFPRSELSAHSRRRGYEFLRCFCGRLR